MKSVHLMVSLERGTLHDLKIKYPIEFGRKFVDNGLGAFVLRLSLQKAGIRLPIILQSCRVK